MNPWCLLLLTLFSLYDTVVEAEEPSAPISPLPEFCHNRQCPRFTLIKKYEHFEHRAYEATRWVRTTVDLTRNSSGIRDSILHLLEYINGKNSEAMQIEMTVPVSIAIPFDTFPPTRGSMGFFLPPTLNIPPTPTDNDIVIYNFPAKSLYVKSFGGQISLSRFVKKAKDLAKELKELNKKFDTRFFGYNSYEKPNTSTKRHNEVFFLAL